uniref:LYL1 basic helix-loop-helix family member n=1 Tax=Equus asinus asinus TaxID=83772 RepID=A0A8C4L305_EQUAS
MCPPQAQAEVGPTMTEKAEMVCAPSPAPAPPPKPASPGSPKVEEVGRRGCSPPRLPPGVPVISLGHTRPPGAAMATTELSALRPPLLPLSTLGAAPPPLALHYHPHPFLNSLYIGPAGPFGIFPSSRLKRRPSHCELELPEGECGAMCARPSPPGPTSVPYLGREVAGAHRRPHGTAHTGAQCCKTTDPWLVPHNRSHPRSHKESWQNTAWHGGHKMTAPLEHIAPQETATGQQPLKRQPHKRQPWDHNHTGGSHTTTAT